MKIRVFKIQEEAERLNHDPVNVSFDEDGNVFKKDGSPLEMNGEPVTTSSHAVVPMDEEAALQLLGPKTGHRKLTADQVRKIREKRNKEGTSYAKLGEEYGLSPAGIRNVCKGITWKQVSDITDLAAEGMSINEVA